LDSGVHRLRNIAIDARLKPSRYEMTRALHQKCRAKASAEREVVVMKNVLVLLLLTTASTSAETIQGRWKLVAAEDRRADGSVARYPWGRHPIGSIVVEGGACYVQIMSSDVPSFAAGATTAGEQMKAALLSTYIAYSGPCTINETEGSVMLKVEAAWRPDYVGTEQKRFFRFENGKLLFGPAPNSTRGGTEPLTRRLTLERAN
jgi:hypothetical protein